MRLDRIRAALLALSIQRRRISSVGEPLLAWILVTGMCSASTGAEGDLDSSFGSNGTVTTSFGSFDEGRGVAIQADGKIVVAGYADSADFAVARYELDGSLDMDFGIGGKVTTDFGGSELGFAVALLSDGGIIVAGTAGADFAVARYKQDGSLDLDFGTGGKVTTDFGGDDRGQAVAVQGDGKILVAGQAFVAGQSYNFGVARYSIDGSLDMSFGTGGKVTTDFSGGTDDGRAVAVQMDGKIVVIGEAAQTDFGLVRYNSNGIPDASFGIAGKVRTDFAFGADAGNAIAIQVDGKILVVGQVFVSAQGFYNYGIARYNPDGGLDVSFGGGKVHTDFFGATDFGNAIVLQTDGKIVVAGRAFVSPRNVFGLVRYNSDSSLDTSFGVGGKVTTDFGGAVAAGNAVVIQNDDKIVVAGLDCATFKVCSFALARYIATSAASDAVLFDSSNRPRLLPASPNPFRPRTLISFDLALPGWVELSIFDVRGRQIRRLLHAPTLTAGRHSLAWDGDDDRGKPTAPGVYFETLRTATGVDVSRVVRVR